MIHIKNTDGIQKMRESNRIIALLFDKLCEYIKPGISTWELDIIADDFIRSKGATPAFKGYSVPGLKPFPGSICSSVNSCIVHGIPSKKIILKDGDIIGIDVGTLKNGYHGDAARTYTVGQISKDALELIKVTKKALEIGISQAVAGARVGDISYGIGSFVKSSGYFVADSLTGHGIGRELHEDPMIPNSGIKGKGARLKKGMTLAIEPMVNIGTNKVYEQGWEFYVKDRTLSAHFEHTILVTDGEPEKLSEILN
jgi:methionyl aminopeptidase